MGGSRRVGAPEGWGPPKGGGTRRVGGRQRVEGPQRWVPLKGGGPEGWLPLMGAPEGWGPRRVGWRRGVRGSTQILDTPTKILNTTPQHDNATTPQHHNTHENKNAHNTTHTTHTTTHNNTHNTHTTQIGQKWIGQNWPAKHDAPKWIGHNLIGQSRPLPRKLVFPTPLKFINVRAMDWFHPTHDTEVNLKDMCSPGGNLRNK